MEPTPEAQRRIADLIRAGNTTATAVAAVGIDEESFDEWLLDDEFRGVIEQAKAEAESILVTRVAKAASSGSWQAAAWLLERSAPERWGKAVDRRMASEQEQAKPGSEFDDLDGPSTSNVSPIRKPA